MLALQSQIKGGILVDHPDAQSTRLATMVRRRASGSLANRVGARALSLASWCAKWRGPATVR
eukprot:9777503-Alexandrium_andersonii.AAC.1